MKDFFLRSTIHPHLVYQLNTKEININGVTYFIDQIENMDVAIDTLCELFPETSYDKLFVENLCPYFGVIWNSSIGLTQYLSKIDLKEFNEFHEIGCGLGLPSMFLKKQNHQVFSYDFHPDVELFLKHNFKKNNIENSFFTKENFDNFSSFNRQNLYLASDVMYERHQIDKILNFLDRLPKGTRFILSDPQRVYFVELENNLKKKTFDFTKTNIQIGSDIISILDFYL